MCEIKRAGIDPVVNNQIKKTIQPTAENHLMKIYFI